MYETNKMSVVSTKSYSVTLPYPPTVNHYRVPMVIKGRARLIESKAGRDYKAATQYLWKQQGYPTLTGRLAVTLCATMPDRRARDLDNICKVLLDAPVNAAAFEDDSQIDRLTVMRCPVDAKNPRVDVCVWEIP